MNPKTSYSNRNTKVKKKKTGFFEKCKTNNWQINFLKRGNFKSNMNGMKILSRNLINSMKYGLRRNRKPKRFLGQDQPVQDSFPMAWLSQKRSWSQEEFHENWSEPCA